MTTARISSGTATRNTRLRSRLICMVFISAVTSITGARTHMRMPMNMVICTDDTSLVRRVMRLAVEKCSMLAKEKRCTCSYSAWRRLAPKPMAALAASAAAPTPHSSVAMAIRNIFRPVSRI